MDVFVCHHQHHHITSFILRTIPTPSCQLIQPAQMLTHVFIPSAGLHHHHHPLSSSSSSSSSSSWSLSSSSSPIIIIIIYIMIMVVFLTIRQHFHCYHEQQQSLQIWIIKYHQQSLYNNQEQQRCLQAAPWFWNNGLGCSILCEANDNDQTDSWW